MTKRDLLIRIEILEARVSDLEQRIRTAPNRADVIVPATWIAPTEPYRTITICDDVTRYVNPVVTCDTVAPQ